MGGDGSFVALNREARERLQTVVGRLSDDDLRRPLGAGWTVATSLAHVAFWDRRMAILLDTWTRDGIKPSPADVDTINDVALIQARLIPPRAAAEEAVEAARAVDERLEAISDDLLEAIRRNGIRPGPDRASHRHEHLDEIEKVLGKQ